jgi:hypothetical protein
VHTLHRLYSWTRGTRRRTVVAAIIAALALSGTAFAAWTYFTGGSGTAYGKFGNATATNALTFTQDSALFASANGVPVAPGQDGDLALRVTNLAGVLENVTGLTATFTTVPAACASHLSLNPSGSGTGNYLIAIPANANNQAWLITGALHADASTPTSCANGDVSVALTATTQP